MNQLIVGLAVFFGVHTVAIVAPGWRDRMAARMGERAWKGVYAIVSAAGFVLLVGGYDAARATADVLYTTPPSMRYVAMLLMLPVFPLLIAAYVPSRIKEAVKHPMLLATILWAIAHLLVNGSVADVLLFGGFLAWAVADRISVASRPPRPGRGRPDAKPKDAIAVVVGLAIYALLVFWAHAKLFYVPVIV